MPGFDCEYRKWPVCPNCGYEHYGVDSDFDFDTNEVVQTECDRCGESITITQHIKITYSTTVA